MDIVTILDIFAKFAEVAGAIVSVFALYFALNANRISKETQDDARQHQKEEIENLRRSQAAEFQAWWALREEDGEEKWGLFISHNHPGSGVIYDVKINACTAKGAKESYELKQLPPANYFLESVGGSVNGASYALDKWNRIIVVPDSDLDKYHPLTHSARYVVESLQFTDALQVKWQWKHDTGLVKRSK